MFSPLVICKQGFPSSWNLYSSSWETVLADKWYISEDKKCKGEIQGGNGTLNTRYSIRVAREGCSVG